MRRLPAGLLIVLVAAVAVGGALLALQSRDDAGVGAASGPGERVLDRCPAHAAPVTRDRRRLSAAQIQTALAQGNVVVLYAATAPPRRLRRLQHDLSGPFDAEIAVAGQAVILARGGPAEARAWGRRIDARSPQLRDFAEAWLGAGAPEPCPS